MSEDIAVLGIEVKTDSVRRGVKDLDDLESAGKRAERSASGLRSGFLSLGSVISGVAVGVLAREFVQTADAMSSMNARLKLTTESQSEFLSVQQQLVTLSNANRAGLQETFALYTKLADPIKRAGGGVRETMSVVDAFSKSLKIGGASAQEAAAATYQFAQAMASGKLSGDEFRSLAEASPRFMKAIADGMGVPREALKKLGEEGELTVDKLGNALIKVQSQLTSEFASLPVTVGEAMTKLKNDISLAVSDINDAGGITSGIVDGINKMSDAFSIVGPQFAEATRYIAQLNSETGASKQVFETLGNAVTTAGETIAIVAANISYVFTGVGREIGGIAAQIASLGRLDFDGFNAIGAAMKEDAERARKELDETERRILEIRKTEEQARADGTSARSEMYRNWSAQDAQYAANALQVLKAYAHESVEIQQQAQLAVAKFWQGQVAAPTLKAAPNIDKAKKDIDELARVLKGLEEKSLAAEVGLAPETIRTLEVLNKAVNSGALSWKKYNAAKDSALDQDPVLKKEQEEIVKAIKAQADFVGKIAEEENRRAESIGKANEKLRDEIDLIGRGAAEQGNYTAEKLKSASAAEEAAAGELNNAAALLEMQQVLPEVSAKYRELAEARLAAARGLSEQAGLTVERGVKKAADDARKEWEKTADSINNSLTDALLRGFESGKSFAENFRDTLKNMFQTLVLRPVISAVLAPVAGGIASLLPGSAMAGQGGAGGAGGMLNLASTGSSLYNMVSGGSGLYSSFATSGIGQAIGLSALPSVTSGMAAIGGTGGGITLAAKTGLTAATQTGITAPVVGGVGEAATLTSLGSTIGAALPWIGGALAIASLFGGGGLFGKKKVPKINLINADMSGLGWSQFDTPFGPVAGAAQHTEDFAQIFDGLKPLADLDKLIASQLTAAEIKAATEAIAGTGTGEIKTKNFSGDDFIRDRLDLITDSIGGWINDLADTATGELAEVYGQTAAILASRKMAGAETLANELLGEGGAAFFRESETAAAAFARMASALETVNPVIEQLNLGALAMSASAGNAATDLLKAFASVEAFQQSTAAYYANFFSEAERAEAEQRRLKGVVYSAFAEFGAQVPKTRTEFRALVESLDVTTESGQKAFAALMNVSSAFAAITVNADAAVAAERRAVIEARRAREAAAQASVDTVAEAVKGLRESVAQDAAIAGGIIGGIRVSADEYEQFSGFADALATARSELAKVPADMTGAIAAIEKQIVETVRLLGEQVAPLRLRQGDAQGALAALMAGVRIPSDRYTDANGNFVAAGMNRAMLFEQAKAAQQLGNRASADALNIQNVGGVLASLAGITQSQDFQFALREQMAGSLGVPIQGALMDVLSGAFDFAAGAAASGYVSNGIGLARVRATGAQLSAAQTGADIDAYKAAIRNLNGAMKAGSIDAEQYQTGLDAIGEIFKDVIPLVDNLEAQAERVRNASLEWGRAGLESITYYFGQIGEQVAQMAEAAAAAAEPIALATSAIGRMNSVSAVFGESANAAYYGLAGGGADGRAMLNGSLGTIGNAALVSTAAAIAAEIMTTADAARVAEQLSEQFAGTQRRDASLLLDGLSAYDSAAFERSFARLNNALNKGDISTDQYRELFDLSIKTYQGTENAANDLQDAFAELRRAAKSLADELLIDKGLTPLSTPQRFAEIRRQYEETIEKARTGDLEAIGDMEGITRTMLEAARNNAGSAEEYNLFSAGTIRTLRDLEAEQPLVLNPTPLLSGRSNVTDDMLKELQALRAEIAAMRADNSAENVAIVKATNKTASVLDAVTTGNLTFVTEAA